MAGFEDEDAPIEPVQMKRPGKATTAAAAKPPAKPEAAGVDLVELVTDKPIEVLLEDDQRAKLIEKITAEIKAFVPDLSTEASRGRIKSLHFKIVRTRTTLDKAGKDHTEDLRTQVEAVNEKRRAMREDLGKLEDLALKPYTEWEAAEARRLGAIEEVTNALKTLSKINPLATAADIDRQIKQLAAIKAGIEEEVVGTEEKDRLEGLIVEATADMVVTLEIVRRREEEEAETARLRAENEALRAQIPAKTTTAEAPAAEPIRDQREIPPLVGSGGAPAAEASAEQLSPTRKARRLVLPALATFGITGDQAKKLILGIEAGELPGITANYL